MSTWLYAVVLALVGLAGLGAGELTRRAHRGR
jgi:hypothetical protein